MNTLEVFKRYNLKDWKLINTILHKDLLNVPDLMDVEFFNDFQTYLQEKASHIGLDISEHETWIDWLKNEIG